MFVNRHSLRNLAGRLGASRTARLRTRSGPLRWSLRRPILGIEVRGSALYLACLRPGLGRRWLLGTDTIPDFHGLAVEELHPLLRKLLGKWGADDPVVVLGCPRRDAIVRHLDLPLAAESSLDEALDLQVSLFKPNDDVEFCSDATAIREGQRLAASLVLLPQSAIEKIVAKFIEAGFPPSRLTVTQFALLDLVLRGAPADRPAQFIVVRQEGMETELAAVLGGALLYSRSLALPAEPAAAAQQLTAAADQAFASLRWTQPIPVVFTGTVSAEMETALAALGPRQLLPEWLRTAVGKAAVAEDSWGAIALAFDGADWFGTYRLNLLPVGLRARRRYLGYLPTYVLLAVNVLLLIALGLRAPLQRRVLLREYRDAIAAVQAPAARSQRELDKDKRIRQQLGLLLQFQQQGQRPLGLLANVTGKLPSDAWLNFFTYRGGELEIDGTAKSAAGVLSSLQSLPDVEDVRFGGALTRDDSGLEHFRIQMRVRGNQ